MLKKILSLMITAVVFTSCGLYNSGSINDLQLGATKQEVDSRFGYPLRMLSMGNAGGMYSEVYEYKIRSSVYALEYLGNRLNHVEFMYDYDDYYPSTQPPNYHPNRPPGKPSKPNKPGEGSNVRPPSSNGGSNRPESNRPGTGGTSRPPAVQERPGTSTKPAEPAKPETGSNRPSGRPGAVTRSTTTSESENSSSESSTEKTNSTTRTR